jgi:2-oxoglutarate ferredoxin oxidoreductase subunit delta
LAKLDINGERCKGCELCISVCPKKILGLSEKINAQGYHFVELKGTDCIGCAFCARICPDVAIEVYK